jgi:hypothetical protein
VTSLKILTRHKCIFLEEGKIFTSCNDTYIWPVSFQCKENPGSLLTENKLLCASYSRHEFWCRCVRTHTASRDTHWRRPVWENRSVNTEVTTKQGRWPNAWRQATNSSGGHFGAFGPNHHVCPYILQWDRWVAFWAYVIAYVSVCRPG